MVDKYLLWEYMNNFMEYGNPQGKYWFIGMEEGGGKFQNELEVRINSWNDMGRDAVVDIEEYHNKLNNELPGFADYFGDRGKVSPTWLALSKIKIAIEATDNDDFSSLAREALDYQRYSLGRRNGAEFLTELLPLPSKNNNSFDYQKYSDEIPVLRSRETYEKEFGKIRLEKLKKKINGVTGKIIIMYGLKYEKKWSDIVGMSLKKYKDFVPDCGKNFGLYITRKKENLFVMMGHPAPSRISHSDEYYINIGKKIREHAHKM